MPRRPPRGLRRRRFRASVPRADRRAGPREETGTRCTDTARGPVTARPRATTAGVISSRLSTGSQLRPGRDAAQLHEARRDEERKADASGGPPSGKLATAKLRIVGGGGSTLIFPSDATQRAARRRPARQGKSALTGRPPPGRTEFAARGEDQSSPALWAEAQRTQGVDSARSQRNARQQTTADDTRKQPTSSGRHQTTAAGSARRDGTALTRKRSANAAEGWTHNVLQGATACAIRQPCLVKRCFSTTRTLVRDVPPGDKAIYEVLGLLSNACRSFQRQ
jgi:hypothetical protein